MDKLFDGSNAHLLNSQGTLDGCSVCSGSDSGRVLDGEECKFCMGVMNNEHDIVDRLRSVGGYFDAAALKYVSCSEAADEIERLRNALLRIECELINAENLARAALDGPNA